MKLLITLAILCLSLSCFGQKIRFTDPTNEWIVRHDYETNPGHKQQHKFYKYHYSGTVQLNGYVYSQFDGNTQLKGLVREDTVANIVYHWDGTADKVLYNYNWKIGDTVDKSWDPVVVTHVDSIQINGYWHKRFGFYNGSVAYGVIESIGGGLNLLKPFMFLGGSSMGAWANCFKNNGMVPSSTINTFNQCGDTVLNIFTTANKPNSIHIYPQPAQHSVSFVLPAIMHTGIFNIASITGHVVYNATFKNEKELHITNPGWHGLYLYRITSDEGEMVTGKVLFE